MKDIHLEKGMHCVDCHFKQDATATASSTASRGRRSRSTASTATARSRARPTSPRPAPPPPATDLTALSTPFGQPRFTSRRGKITQRCMVDENVEWEVPQVVDAVTPGNPRYSEKARLAKTMQMDGSDLGRRGRRPHEARPRQQQDELLRLPLVVDDELLRLPPLA